MRVTTFLLAILALPPLLSAQKIKTNTYDKFPRQQSIASEPLWVIQGPKNKLSLSFYSNGSAFYLEMSGSGWGASTIDADNELILLFSNDSIVSVRSPALQTFEQDERQSRYRHHYLIQERDLEKMRQYELVSMRKYSFKDFSDVSVPGQSREKIKALSALFLSELKKTQVVKTLKLIEGRDIPKHLGDSVRFCATIAAAGYDSIAANGSISLSLETQHGQVPALLLIRQQDRPKFPHDAARFYKEKNICVSGVVRLTHNRAEIIVFDPSQIKIASPLRLEEVAEFIGDSVSVTGKVVSSAFLSRSANQLTLLNMGATYPNQLLTVVIENNDRPQFREAPEKRYLQKEVEVRGKVTLYNNKPQIIIRSEDQIRIIGEQKIEQLTEKKAAAAEENVTKTPKQIEVALPVHREKVSTASTVEESAAEYTGGPGALLRFMESNLTCPAKGNQAARKTVVASYFLEPDGSVSNIQIVESGGKPYNEEVIRVLRKMPRWKPRIRNGYMVMDKLFQTFTFHCQDKNE